MLRRGVLLLVGALVVGSASGRLMCAAESEFDQDVYCVSDELAHWEGYSNADIVGDDSPLVITDELLQPQFIDDDGTIPAFFQEQAPLVPQQQTPQATPQPSAAQAAANNLFNAAGAQRSLLTSFSAPTSTSTDVANNWDAKARVTTDAGNLLGKTPSVLGVTGQRRNPIVTDPRIRGNRVGSLAASGSYWVPARIDLDTVLSKMDSRIIDQVTVIKGPYSALYGPGFEFFDVELPSAPRSEGPHLDSHGSTSFDFKSNGENWLGRQSLWGSNQDWGYRVGYNHRTGNDYESGNGTQIPSSYNSREWDVALGADISTCETVDLHYLRLDQTNVELAGQAFDIDWLVTDGYDVRYVVRKQPRFDELSVDTWYNRTRFEGSAQRRSKREQFPYYDTIGFTGFTDVDSMSTGYRAAVSWDGCQDERLTAGADLRYIKQELNEITSGHIGFDFWEDANSPIPRSHLANPGLFTEYRVPVTESVTVRTGSRIDWTGSNIEESQAELAQLGVRQPQQSAAWILGSDQFDQDEFLGAAFVATDWDLGNCWSAGWNMGYAEQSPNLTERYAVEPFMFLLQRGLNTVTGSPELDKERTFQVDVRLSRETDHYRGTVMAYHAWLFDYITFENMSVVKGPPNQQVEQVNLKYVNTALAIRQGFEGRSEYDLNAWWTPFATVKYVQGDDLTRNGTFATRQATSVTPSEQVAGLPRGFFSGITGNAREPLPGIPPLESRLGIRFHEPCANPTWGFEVSARVADEQDRVAASLLETPTPGFTTYDFRTYWRPRENMLLLAGVENFTNKQYQEHLDFRSENPLGLSTYQPGINFYVGGELTY
jgi:outer membrane receptor protein involved in Fe transport